MRHPYWLIFLLFIFALALDAETVSPGSGPNAVHILSSSPEETVLQVRINSFEAHPLTLESKQWQILSLPKEGVLLKAGYPQLPVFNRSLAIPASGLMKLELLDSEYVEYSLDVLPSKGNLTRDVDPDTVPYSFSDVYRQDAFYPDQIAELSEPYILSDIRGITVRTVPFAYNPVRGILRVYTSFTLRVYQDGLDSVNVLPAYRESIPRAFSDLYENQFINWNSTRYVAVNDSFGKLLVICHSSFLTTIQPWVNWKRQKGIETEVVEMSSIGTTAAQLQTYIQTRYNTDTQIKYVQLVGDVAQIPTVMYQDGESDPTYALVAGSDNYPDIFIGRFSAETTWELTPQLNKTIEYERDLGTTATWLSKAMGVASNQGPGDNDEMDNEHMNVIRGKLLTFGYSTVDQIYDPTATAAQVTTAINDGRGFVNYCGHGSTSSWGTTGFNNTNVASLSNLSKTPVIMSVACLNGNFSGASFAEAWLQKLNGGAVNMYASSISQTWSPPMRAQDEVTDLLVASSKYTAGGLFFNGSCKMIDVYGDNGAWMYKTWHIFGDASLLVRSKTPQSMTVTHPTGFTIGVGFTVSTGVSNALVAVYKNGVIHARAYANSSGNATLTVSSGGGVCRDLHHHRHGSQPGHLCRFHGEQLFGLNLERPAKHRLEPGKQLDAFRRSHLSVRRPDPGRDHLHALHLFHSGQLPQPLSEHRGQPEREHKPPAGGQRCLYLGIVGDQFQRRGYVCDQRHVLAQRFRCRHQPDRVRPDLWAQYDF